MYFNKFQFFDKIFGMRLDSVKIEPTKIKKRLSPFQIIILGFAGVILTGALLLMLPISSQAGISTSFNEALFTATSAVCVTGLVVHDTATYWSYFGQSIIFLLFQIGGLGVITVVASFSLLSGRKISLMERSTMQETISAPKVGGVVRLTSFILKATLLIELIGAIALMPTFISDFGLRGIWMSFFHSVSAFCNAGFDLTGAPDAKFTSLIAYAGNPIVSITIMLLIIVGGIGFLTWDDICSNKFRFRRYRMQSKVIITTTLLLIIIPAIFFYLVDFAAMSLGERLLCSLFQSVTPRTAGFNTADLTLMTTQGQAITIMLMIIGGSPGSTAGGIKTTTFAVLLANLVACFRKKEDPQFFGARIGSEAVKNASTIFMLYLILFFGGALAISLLDNIPIGKCLYETASAIGTVGLSLGITPQISVPSQCILIALMFLGRVGGLTLIYATLLGPKKNLSRLPQERITIG